MDEFITACKEIYKEHLTGFKGKVIIAGFTIYYVVCGLYLFDVLGK